MPANSILPPQPYALAVVELALAFDHRQIDGAMASRVLSHIGAFLGDPATALIAG